MSKLGTVWNGTSLRERAAKTGLSPHGGCPRLLRCKPPPFHSPQTSGTAPGRAWDSPEFTTKVKVRIEMVGAAYRFNKLLRRQVKRHPPCAGQTFIHEVVIAEKPRINTRAIKFGSALFIQTIKHECRVRRSRLADRFPQIQSVVNMEA